MDVIAVCLKYYRRNSFHIITKSNNSLVMQKISRFAYEKAVIFCLLVGMMFLQTSCTSISSVEITKFEMNKVESDMRGHTLNTPLTTSLLEFGKMLNTYNVPRTKIQYVSVTHSWDRDHLASDFTDMFANTVETIGEKVTFVPNDFYYLNAEMHTSGKINNVHPDLIVRGGLIEFDDNLINKTRSGSADGNWIGANVGASANYNGSNRASFITIDFSPIKYHNLVCISGAGVSNSILLKQNSFGFGGAIYYNGISLNAYSSKNLQQGKGRAFRIIVQLNTIELLGRFFKVPYWRCLPGAEKDTVLIGRLKRDFNLLSKKKKLLLINKYLTINGYKGNNIINMMIKDKEQLSQKKYLSMRKYLRKMMEKQKCKSYAEFYLKLWETVPIPGLVI